jgi:hypothetical protein
MSSKWTFHDHTSSSQLWATQTHPRTSSQHDRTSVALALRNVHSSLDHVTPSPRTTCCWTRSAPWSPECSTTAASQMCFQHSRHHTAPLHCHPRGSHTIIEPRQTRRQKSCNIGHVAPESSSVMWRKKLWSKNF